MGVGQVGEIAELHLHVVGPEEVWWLERVPLRHIDRTADDDPLVRVQVEWESPASAHEPRGSTAKDDHGESSRHPVPAERLAPVPQRASSRAPGRGGCLLYTSDAADE